MRRSRCYLTGSSHLQRGSQCDWCPRSAPAVDARPRFGSARGAFVNPFTYSSPTDLPSALALLGKQWGRTEILAGGTDLLALLKDDILAPSQLVNIKKVGELQ